MGVPNSLLRRWGGGGGTCLISPFLSEALCLQRHTVENRSTCCAGLVLVCSICSPVSSRFTPGLNHSFSVLGSQLSGAFSTHGNPGAGSAIHGKPGQVSQRGASAAPFSCSAFGDLLASALLSRRPLFTASYSRKWGYQLE